MRGQILSYSPESGEGLISGEDGKRYTFKGTEYHGRVLDIRPGLAVDFEAHEDGSATGVFPVPGAAPVASEKSKVAAGVLGILLGALGAHKFYLGYTGAAVIMLLVTILTCGFGGFVMGIIGLAEGIIYLTKTDQEFDAIYVRNQRTWF